MHDSSTEANYRPVEVRRPPFLHRYEVFSPKLERRITLYSWDAVLVWMLLEGIAQIDGFGEGYRVGTPYAPRRAPGANRSLVVAGNL